MEDISLKEIYRMFRRRMKLIITFTIIGVVLAFALSGVINYFFYTPEYETYTSVLIKRGNNAENLEMLKSQSLSQKVIDSLNLDISTEELDEKMEVNLIRDTEMIKIKVLGEDPEQLASIANERVKIFKNELEGSSRIKNVQIVDEAKIPDLPLNSPSNTKRNMAIGGILGLVLGVLLIVLLEYLDNTIRDPKDIEHLDLSVIGKIPMLNDNWNSGEKKSNIVIGENQKPLIGEALKILRTNIQYFNNDKVVSSMTISSPKAGNGSTFISVNLAIALAKTESKVLLIEGDLRDPSMHEYFNVINSVGLTNVLKENLDYNEAIHKAKGITGLDIITSGSISSNSSELLGSTNMKNLLKEMKKKYDMIIIDTPPIGAITDGAVLSTMADNTLLVCAFGETEIDEAEKAKTLLNKVNANILGVVLNKIPLDNGFYNDYGYSDYYGKSDIDNME